MSVKCLQEIDFFLSKMSSSAVQHADDYTVITPFYGYVWGLTELA